jgi:esterase/lipase
MMRPWLVMLVAILLMAGGAGPAGAAASLGVVLLHGKNGTPEQMAKLAATLKDAGYAVSTPEMCWSKARIFDKALPDCLKEVDAAVAGLKSGGASRIVIGGVSQGAIVAIDYGATHTGLAGVVALAPAADPPDASKYPDFAAAIKTAQAAVKARKGNEVGEYDDLIDGAPITVNATAANYLSFHDPKAPSSTIRGVKGKLLPKLTVPLLWVAGTKDPTQASTRAVFGAAPDNKLSTYERVEADHAGTPDASGDIVVAWLKTLP